MRAILLALFLAGCGAVSPTLKLRNDFIADAYGFACACGSQVFEILGHDHIEWRLRCPDCHRERVVIAKDR